MAGLNQIVNQGANVILLCGPGGVGKSALARQWAHSARSRFADGQIHADLRGFSGADPLDPGAALTAFLQALGTPPQRIPADLREQVALYRTVTATRSIFLLLDDALSAAQVRPLVPASSSAVVVVTSRRRLTGLIPDGARLLDVGPLPGPAGVELLGRAVGRERIAVESGEAQELVRICGGLPLALVVAAARLAARPRLTVRRVVSELADETERLSRLSATEGLSMRAMIEVSYAALTPAAAMLYRRLALHPGTEFCADLVATVAATDPGDPAPVDGLIDELLEASLLEETVADRFRLHDLLRLYGREMSERHDSEDDRRAVSRAILEFYLAAARRADLAVTPYRRRLPYAYQGRPADTPAFSGRADALAWLQRERENLMDAGRAAVKLGLHELAWQLSDVTWPLWLYTKDYARRLEVDQRGVQAARAWGNRQAEADMLKRLSRVQSRVGNHQAAERYGLAAVERHREIGDVQGTVDAEEGLATLYADTGREQQAAEAFDRVLTARRSLPDLRSLGLTCLNLGMLLTRMGRPADALPLLAEATDVFAGLTETDPYNGARVLLGVADAQLGLGDLDAADDAATEAAGRMAQLGSANEQAEALDLLGRIAERRGNDDIARRCYREAVAIFESIGSPRLAAVRRRLEDVRGSIDEQ
ncbi:hypothetical protein CIK06_08925 [Plantactinospora sp. KBS50]|nr:hypothetical protein CIK06_08925 [Plantactinospora sp. KBS50]